MERSLVLLCLAGCGRIGFDPFGSRSSSDGNTDATDGNTTVVANRIFMTADTFGLPGTYLAWLGTSTAPPESRFVDGPTWVRVDGVRLAATALDYLSPTTPPYFEGILNRSAANQVTPQLTYTGADASSTCGDWMAISGPIAAGDPRSLARGKYRQSMDLANCGGVDAIVCLQE